MLDWNQIYQNDIPKLKNYIRKLCSKSGINPEDVFSETIERAYTKQDSFDIEKASFITWICTIAFNVFLQHKKLQSKFIDNTFLNQDDKGELLDNIFGKIEESTYNNEIDQSYENVLKIFNKMEDSISKRLFIELMKGTKYKDMAEMFNIEISAVKIWLFRFKNELRKQIYKNDKVLENTYKGKEGRRTKPSQNYNKSKKITITKNIMVDPLDNYYLYHKNKLVSKHKSLEESLEAREKLLSTELKNIINNVG